MDEHPDFDLGTDKLLAQFIEHADQETPFDPFFRDAARFGRELQARRAEVATPPLALAEAESALLDAAYRVGTQHGALGDMAMADLLAAVDAYATALRPAPETSQ